MKFSLEDWKHFVPLLGKTIFYKQYKKSFKKVELKRVKNILIFKTGAIGDVLMTSPFLRVLRKKYPKAKITYYVGKWSKPILKDNPNIDKIVAFDDKIVFQKRFFKILWLILKLRRKNFDICFDLEKSYLFHLLIYLAGIPIRAGLDRKGEGFLNTINVPYGAITHEVDTYLNLAKIVGAEVPQKPDLELNLSKHDIRFAEKFLKRNKIKRTDKIVGIIPGGAKNPGQEVSSKRWLKERYKELAKTLKKKGWKIIILGGPSDKDLVSDFLEYPIMMDSSLKEMGGIMKFCKYIICNDSGPMHIAEAVGPKVIAIFGPTDPRKWGPYSKKHTVIWKHLGCAPCYKDGKFPICKGLKCMYDIQVKDVSKHL
ncbi:MAG: lipopolysaccharide heptosyltransferase II [Nanoarchaeota archaeon]|nr:lipopolysaccharide heptosyltransferase II [Nanoarchaeota archaeon]